MPMDKPRAALDMIGRFLSERSFADRVLPTAGVCGVELFHCCSRVKFPHFCLSVLYFKRCILCPPVEYAGVELPKDTAEATSEAVTGGGSAGLLLLLLAAALGNTQTSLLFTQFISAWSMSSCCFSFFYTALPMFCGGWVAYIFLHVCNTVQL